MDARQSRRSRDFEHIDASDDPNVFADEYAESFAESYADSQDGLSLRRPDSLRSITPPLDRRPSLSRDLSHPQMTQPSTLHRTSGSISKTGPLANNASPIMSSQDPFADHAALPPISTDTPSRDSTHRAMAHRSLSTSSFAGSQIASPTSPHEGPSHPYAMYPQALSMSRTPSVATSSNRPTSLVSTSRGPTHPYESYSQTVTQDAAPEQSAIQVGFPGANTTYLRRMGPEGEEQDIIGADGHAEQLPPYSRYPEEVHLKAVNALPPIDESSPTQPSAPNVASQEALTARSSRSNLPMVINGRPMTRASSSDGTGLSEKSWAEKSWKEKRRTKICGVALGLWMLAFVTLAIIILISSTVIAVTFGVVKARHHREAKEAAASASKSSSSSAVAASQTSSVSVTQTHTSFVDAAPVSTTPYGLAPLPTGLYNLDTSEPAFQAQSCLPPQEQAAWSCDLPQNKVLLNVSASTPHPMLQMIPIDHSFWYGVQPPVIQPQPMQLVQDMSTPGNPLAWQFLMNYKKVVVLHGDALDFNASLSTRDLRGDLSSGGFGMSEKALETDDQPWFCEWPSTQIEVMVYVGNGSTMFQNETTSTAPQYTQTVSPLASTFTPPTAASSQQTTSGKGRRDYIGSSASTPIPTYAEFPQLIRIVERRLQGSTSSGGFPPTCTQMHNVGTNGTIDYKPTLFNGNQLRVFKLDEDSQPPPPPPQQSQPPQSSINHRSNDLEQRDGSTQNLCECIWDSPYGVNPSSVFGGQGNSSPTTTPPPSSQITSATQPQTSYSAS